MTRGATLLLAAWFLLLPGACKKKEPDGPVRGSGVGATAARTPPPFQEISVGGTIRAEVEVGKPLSVELRGEDNLLPLVPTKVEAGTLKLVPDQVLKPSQPLVARISIPTLDAIELFAASSGFVNGINAQHFAVTAAGKHAVTHYETIEAFPFASLLKVHLETGRTHQIRVHMAAQRHPCAGDAMYGADPTLSARLGLTRQWLHAKELSLTHPGTGRWTTFESEYPADLAHALDVLRGD